jgi:chromosome segregation ATPase
VSDDYLKHLRAVQKDSTIPKWVRAQAMSSADEIERLRARVAAAESDQDLLAGLTDVIRTAEREHLNRFAEEPDLRKVVRELGYRDVKRIAALEADRERLRARVDEEERKRRNMGLAVAIAQERIAALEAENRALRERNTEGLERVAKTIDEVDQRNADRRERLTEEVESAIDKAREGSE